MRRSREEIGMPLPSKESRKTTLLGWICIQRAHLSHGMSRFAVYLFYIGAREVRGCRGGRGRVEIQKERPWRAWRCHFRVTDVDRKGAGCCFNGWRWGIEGNAERTRLLLLIPLWEFDYWKWAHRSAQTWGNSGFPVSNCGFVTLSVGC